jgi:CheY-like chemotaxis protein
MIESRPRRVLVVDDDSLSRELLQLLLTRHGYGVELAESGEAALQILENRNLPRPNAVLADLQMPGITGGLLAERIRSMCGDDLRVIAMSGSEANKAAVEGFDGFLRKPFTIDALDRLIVGEIPSSSREGSPSMGTVVLNREVYERLSSSMSPAKVAELYALCLSDTRCRMAVIQQAWASEDDGTCRKQAHAIKGSCSMVGAIEMANLAGYIEEHGVTTTPTDTLDELLRACGRLESMLNDRSTQQSRTVEETARRSHA